jgi:hypothetical protein
MEAWRKLRRGAQGSGRGQRGQVVVWVLLCMPLFLALIGLVADGGRMYWEYTRARNVARLAAQAGAQMVDEGAFAGARNELVIKTDGANRVIRDYLELNGVDWRTQGIIHVYRDAVRVCVRREAPMSFMSLFGVDSVEVTGCSQAVQAGGITRAGQ